MSKDFPHGDGVDCRATSTWGRTKDYKTRVLPFEGHRVHWDHDTRTFQEAFAPSWLNGGVCVLFLTSSRSEFDLVHHTTEEMKRGEKLELYDFPFATPLLAYYPPLVLPMSLGWTPLPSWCTPKTRTALARTVHRTHQRPVVFLSEGDVNGSGTDGQSLDVPLILFSEHGREG